MWIKILFFRVGWLFFAAWIVSALAMGYNGPSKTSLSGGADETESRDTEAANKPDAIAKQERQKPSFADSVSAEQFMKQAGGDKNESLSSFAGSKSCRDCHPDFYERWSTSWHGLAMQPYSYDFAKKHLTAQEADVTIGGRTYRAEIGDAEGWIKETGPEGERKYPFAHVMGGKNIVFFLTPWERGRLQVLPLAYDVNKKGWYEMASTIVRHFPDRDDEVPDWTDRMFCFNTSCFNCHVSYLRTNYNIADDSYKTTWTEPGNSCETCHGFSGEHNRRMQRAVDPQKVRDMKIIKAKSLSASQINDLCATCHAKIIPLSVDFGPGDKLFDHFDMVLLEHPDYYPDGRDLGDNYTYTSWSMSPCAKSGKLDCRHCHTPSGRLQFPKEELNKSCSPCHDNYVKNPVEHGHHQPGSTGNDCIGCHMPMTWITGMKRTDHSMLPPTAVTTIAFKSPNACNTCHADKDAAWSDEWIRKWYPRDYQTPVLRRAELIDCARKGDWKRLPEMLTELTKRTNDAVFKASLARLLRGCEEESIASALVEALHDVSPLVRASAATTLGDRLAPEVIEELLKATADDSRLVRIRAAMALAALPEDRVANNRDRYNLSMATKEFIAAMQARPDDWSSYANVGDFYMKRRDFSTALDYFAIASKLDPRQIGPLVNAAMAYGNLGRNDKAEESLRQALKRMPNNAAVHFNLGLLCGEQGRFAEAKEALQNALKADPDMHQAAYNLAVLSAEDDVDEGMRWCEKARQLRPKNPKYAYTLAFYLEKKGDRNGARELLRQSIQNNPAYVDSYLLLGDILEKQNDPSQAADIYRQALGKNTLTASQRRELEDKIRSLETGTP